MSNIEGELKIILNVKVLQEAECYRRIKSENPPPEKEIKGFSTVTLQTPDTRQSDRPEGMYQGLQIISKKQIVVF